MVKHFIFLDEDGYVYSVLNQKESLVTDRSRSFYCYKTPTYPLDDDFEDCDFWKNGRKDNKCNLYEFSYENLVKSLKRAVELVSATHASGNNYVLVMSFHFAEMDFKESEFPYR